MEKLFFNKGLIRDLFFWGKAWSLNLAILEMACFPSGLPGAALAQLAAIVNPANNKGLVLLGKAWSLNLGNFGKGLLPFWASRGCSGTACCNSEPSKQTYSDRDAFTGSDREMSKNLTELQRF